MGNSVKTLVCDFGIDSLVSPIAGSVHYPLQYGVAEMTTLDTGEGVPFWITRTAWGSNFAFRFWDITPSPTPLGGSPAGAILLVSTTILFTSREDSSQLASPFLEPAENPICYSQSQNGLFDAGPNAMSSVFPRAKKGWILGEPTPPLGKVFPLKSDTGTEERFLLKVQVQICLPPHDTIRTYILDPEVYIGPGG